MGIAAAFILGLLGSLHCVGMCGPIALALPYRTKSNSERSIGILFYNFGRVITYAFIGALFGSIGWGLNIAGFQQWISLITGIIILLIAVFSYFGIGKIGSSLSNAVFPSWMRRALGTMMKSNRFEMLGLIGILNGFLPCGLVYIAAGAAISGGNWQQGSLIMMAFGLGTIPAMFSLPFLGQFAGPNFRNGIRKVLPMLMIVMGGLFILRGLNLGIPYISPKILYEVNGGIECH